jgi:hypothetical protein
MGKLPNANQNCYIDLRFHLMDHCSFCGSEDHESTDCTTLAVPCTYDHGPEVVLPPHSLMCCPALHAFCSACKIRGHLAEVHGRNWKSAGELRRLFLESAPFGLYTSLPFLHRDKTNAAKITNHHFKMCIAGKSLQYSYCDYWLYGGVQDPSAELLEKSEKYQERTLFNLTSTPETFKSLKFEKERVAELNKAKAEGTVPEKSKKKRLSGAQCRKRNRTLADNKRREEEQQEKVRRDNEHRENGRRERERRDAAQRKNERRRSDHMREEDRLHADYHRGVRRY